MHSAHQHTIPDHDQWKYYQLFSHVVPGAICAPPTRVVSEPAPNLMLLSYCCFLGPVLSSIVARWVFQQTDAKIRVWNIKGLLGNSTCEREREEAVFVRGKFQTMRQTLQSLCQINRELQGKDSPQDPHGAKMARSLYPSMGSCPEKNVMSV